MAATDPLGAIRGLLRKSWVQILVSQLPHEERLGVLLSRVLLDRAAYHLYRGEALQARLARLAHDFSAWRAASVSNTEDEALDWLAQAIHDLEKEIPDAGSDPSP